jgi:hypothetical protein
MYRSMQVNVLRVPLGERVGRLRLPFASPLFSLLSRFTVDPLFTCGRIRYPRGRTIVESLSTA